MPRKPPTPVPVIPLYFIPAHRIETLHDIVERVLKNYHYRCEYCLNCGECMSCEDMKPHRCNPSTAMSKAYANAA